MLDIGLPIAQFQLASVYFIDFFLPAIWSNGPQVLGVHPPIDSIRLIPDKISEPLVQDQKKRSKITQLRAIFLSRDDSRLLGKSCRKT
jgi:hypothetical protein